MALVVSGRPDETSDASLENAAILLGEAFVTATFNAYLKGREGLAGPTPAALQGDGVLARRQELRARAIQACTASGWSVENPDSVLPSAEDAVNWANYTYVYTKQPSSTGCDGFSPEIRPAIRGLASPSS